jgi:hypothetical protein
MADVRTLKLNLLADVDQFGRSLSKADKQTQSFSGKISKYGKAMAKSFALAGVAAAGYAVKLGVDAVKAAAEDEKSSRILQIQLEKTLGANEALTKGVEDYISATQLRVGVQDDKLRPSFARLVRSTKDAQKAQELLNLALDISVATGKPLEAVSNALGKAYDGNALALGRLGLGIDQSILKSKDFDLIGKELTKTFGGFANKEAQSLDGQLRIVQIRFDELKESAGKRLLPALSDILKKTGEVARAFSGEDPQGLSARARELAGPSATGNLGTSLANLANAFTKVFESLNSDDAKNGNTVLQGFANAINAVAKAMKFLASIKPAVRDFQENNALGRALTSLDNFVLGGTPGNRPYSRAAGGPVTAGQAYRVGEFGPEMFVPSGSGSIRQASGGGTTVINLNGIVDAASARRSIERLLQTQSRISGPINLAGAMP